MTTTKDLPSKPSKTAKSKEHEFSWEQFHYDLDIALATWIVEQNGSIHDEFIKFLEFSFEKSKKAQP